MSTVFANVSTPGPSGPTGPAGYSPKWIVAAGAPTSGVGANGDMYLNNSTGDCYGPKAAGAWTGIVANIKGSTGPAGPTGYSPQYIVAAGAPSSGVGNVGDMYIDSSTSNVFGPKTGGGWGGVVCNIKGATGATGATGAPGVAYTPRGAWVNTIAYLQGDEVTEGSALYIGLAAGTGHQPSLSPTFWQPVGSGGSQTPWLTDIDGATKLLKNVGGIGVGISTPGIQTTAGRAYVTVRGSTNCGTLELAEGPGLDGDTVAVGLIQFTDANSIAADQRVAALLGALDGTTANNRGGAVKVFTKPDGASGFIERMRIAANGNVGIGNNNPASPLTIIQPTNPSTVAAATQIAIGEATNNTAYRLTLGYGIVGGLGVGAIQALNSSAGTTLYINHAGGNIGVGLGTALTTVTRSVLHVSGDSGITVGGGNAGSTNTGGRITFRTDFGANDGVGGAMIQGMNQWGSETNGQAMDLAFFTNQHTGSNAYSGLLERMRITQGGFVGIGCNNPSTALSVIIPVNPNSVATANQITIGENTNNSGYRLSLGYASITGTGASQGVIQATAGGAGAALLLNPSGGKVGIFTNIPGYALDVNGDINCSGAFRVGGVALATPAAGIGLFAAATSGGVTISTVSQVDVPGMALTLARAGRYAITVNLYLTNDGSGGSQGCEGVLIVNGVQDSRYLSNNATYLFSAMQTQQWMLVVAASTPIKVQIAKLNGSGNVNVGGLVSTMTAVWIADS